MSEQQKRVLIITYYWPPSGGSGVQRWLKFAKYLPSNGWQPVIYTPENPEFPSIDPSLEKDVPASAIVIKRPILEPYNIYKRFVGLKKNDRINTGFLSEKEKPGKLEMLSRWIRGNFFIPDARRFWVNPSVRFLKKYLRQNPVDLIISTGPPHSLHLIAQKIQKSTGTPWIADFRDPWTNIDFYSDLMLTSMADKKHHKLEKLVLEDAQHILVVGKTMKDEFSDVVEAEKITVLPNGYDDEDQHLAKADVDVKFSIAHIGSFSPARNPQTLWKVLAELTQEDSNFAADLIIRAVGTIDHSVQKAISDNALDAFVERIPYLPHDLVMGEQQRAAVLMLVVNRSKNAKGILTGKVFEYLLSGRPILAIGPVDGDLAALMEEVGAPALVDYDDEAGLKKRVKELYADFKQQKEAEAPDVSAYSRSALTKKLSHLMDQISRSSDER
ncbi:MAG: glycosyltransferase family 4 protein [Flavobacteriales bacterium]|nr:glycosyltransferase family 4 protein [Flavobacteriales bacterium]